VEGDRPGDLEAPGRVTARSDGLCASVVIGGERFTASPERPLVFGRDDGDGVVGLHADDMGISAVAGSLELARGVWWVINQSTKRPLLLEHPGGTTQMRLAPGHRHALTTDRVDVLVPGAIYTHVLEVALPDAYVAGLRGGGGAFTTGTLTGEAVNLSDRERDALTALCAGYLESFPHRREHPNTYEEAARLLAANRGRRTRCARPSSGSRTGSPASSRCTSRAPRPITISPPTWWHPERSVVRTWRAFPEGGGDEHRVLGRSLP
jgi:hypothetical protein